MNGSIERGVVGLTIGRRAVGITLTHQFSLLPRRSPDDGATSHARWLFFAFAWVTL